MDDAFLSKANQQGRHVVKENWGPLWNLDASIKITNLAKKHLGISDEKKDGEEENNKPKSEEVEPKEEPKKAEQTTPEEQVKDPEVKGVVIMEPTEGFVRVAKVVKNPGGNLVDPNVQTSENSQPKEEEKSPDLEGNELRGVVDAMDPSK